MEKLYLSLWPRLRPPIHQLLPLYTIFNLYFWNKNNKPQSQKKNAWNSKQTSIARINFWSKHLGSQIYRISSYQNILPAKFEICMWPPFVFCTLNLDYEAKKVTKLSSISIEHCRLILVKTRNERQIRARNVNVS